MDEEDQWKLILLLLKDIARQKGITHREIAEATGMTQPNISRTLNGRYPPNLKNLLAVARAIGVNLFFEDRSGTSDLNRAFEAAMSELGRRIDNLPTN